MMRIPQGSDWGRFWPLYDATGQPITDFTNWSALAQVRAKVEDPDPPLFSWQTDPDTDTFPGTASFGNGGVTIAHKGADSLPWSWRFGVWDLRVTNSSGQIAYTARGRVMVIPAVTR